MGDQPDWLNWVRRVPPQDAERIVNEAEREGQNHVEWPRLPDLSDSIPEGARSPRKLKFEEVCIALRVFPWPHLTFLNSHRLKDVGSNTIQNSIVEEHVGIAVADEAGSVRRDS